MTIIGAAELGAERIYVIDALPERLSLGEKLGAIPVNYEKEDPVVTHNYVFPSVYFRRLGPEGVQASAENV